MLARTSDNLDHRIHHTMRGFALAQLDRAQTLSALCTVKAGVRLR